MAARARYHLLEAEYEESHRGRILSETQALLPLRIRGHKVNTEQMVFDERYTPYLRRANLIGFVTMIERGLPTYNSVALTALVDRWHVETHTFHLPCGEMTITLQDMAMLTALPISGWAVTGKIQADRFRDMVEELLGVRPPEKIAGTKGSKTGGLRLTWIEHHFGHLTLDANKETVSRYARAYVMYVFGKVLFSDSGGSDVSWMYLPLLRDWDDAGRYSWGSAGLDYLYRQLDEACRRSKGTSNMGGCVLVLQVWSWLRFPIGRPTTYAPRDWEHTEEDRAPTVVYFYEDVSTKWGPYDNLYRSYTEDFDSLRRGQEWNDNASHKDILQQSWTYNNSRDYETWLQKATRVHLKPSWTNINCLEEGSDEPNEFEKRSGWTSVSTMAPCETVWPVSLYEVSKKLKWR
uniref:Uncharacterized protein n=1 Tax=Avena sativa TaxID=4498 RepID=A0ACD5W6T0_AVESA